MRDPERLRRFARGVQLFRAEQPERFGSLRNEMMAFRYRLALVQASPGDLTLIYRRGAVYAFVFRNLVALLLGFPLFALGFVLFAQPFHIPRQYSPAYSSNGGRRSGATCRCFSSSAIEHGSKRGSWLKENGWPPKSRHWSRRLARG